MLSSLQTLRYHLWKLSKFVFKPSLGGPTICVKECLNSGQKKEYAGMLLLKLMSLAITEAERSPKNALKDNSQILFSHCFVFAFKTRGDHGDSVLISSLSSCSSDRCFSNMCTNCISQWPAILLPVWFDNWMVLFNMFFYLLSFCRFYKGLPPLWMRQIPYTMMKFACFERTVEFLYKHVVPKPRSVTCCLWWRV